MTDIVVQLTHSQGGMKGQVQEFSGPEITIGRSPCFTLHFPSGEPGVSREHAKIVQVIDTYKLLTLRDTFGTFVNGKRIKEAVLADGDEIEFGAGGPKVIFKVVNSFDCSVKQVQKLAEKSEVVSDINVRSSRWDLKKSVSKATVLLPDDKEESSPSSTSQLDSGTYAVSLTSSRLTVPVETSSNPSLHGFADGRSVKSSMKIAMPLCVTSQSMESIFNIVENETHKNNKFKLLLDMSKVHQIEQDGLSRLYELSQLVKKNGSPKIIIRRPNRVILDALILSNTTSLFEIRNDM